MVLLGLFVWLFLKNTKIPPDFAEFIKFQLSELRSSFFFKYLVVVFNVKMKNHLPAMMFPQQTSTASNVIDGLIGY